MNYMNSSVTNIYKTGYYNSSSISESVTNFTYNHISEANIKAIETIKSFGLLDENWGSYNTSKPSQIAIQKAISFVLFLSEYQLDVFFTAPSPDGDILVEVKQNDARVEFEFCEEEIDSVSAWHNDDLQAEAELNDTTQVSYIKWLICSDGNCPPTL